MVTVVHRRDELRASKIMQERAFGNDKIRFVWDSEVVDVLGEGKVEAVKLRNVKTGEECELATDALFLAIGHDPRTDLVKGQIDLDEEGYIKVASPSHGDQTSKACSPPATSSTTPTARPSPRRAPGCAASLDSSAGSPTREVRSAP
ncbi:hypothetical protein GCM10020220_105060 [Nonomuraea rubra]